MDVIFSFSKPVLSSTVASNRIALFLAETLKLPLLWDDEIKTCANHGIDTLFIVNGAFAFCSCLESLAVAVQMAKHVVWVQNDYTIQPPKAASNAESPFRRAFVERTLAGKSPTRFWTTCPINVHHKMDAYVNWNSLTYEPLPAEQRMALRKKAKQDLFYYGAFREKRKEAFERYLASDHGYDTTISSTSAKFEPFTETRRVTLIGGMPRNSFFQELAKHGLGLYIEDDKSHTEFHSPANRFYEMLSAGLPMVFQPEAVPMLLQAGFFVDRWIAEPCDIPRLMRKREKIGEEQREVWSADYVGLLRKHVRKVYARHQKMA